MKSFDSEEQAEIVYFDNHLLVAVKPADWLTQPDEDPSKRNLETYGKQFVKRECNKPGAVFLHCIHRLDRPVFGLVLFARTSKALSRLNEASRAHQIRRIYSAEVAGILSQKEATLEHFLLHAEHRARVVKPSEEGAKQAILNYVMKEQLAHSTLVSIELQTGRYHQIRAQFGAIGHPIVGDLKYGAKSGDGKTIHLACTELRFAHPVTKEELTFHCEAPFI